MCVCVANAASLLAFCRTNFSLTCSVCVGKPLWQMEEDRGNYDGEGSGA